MNPVATLILVYFAVGFGVWFGIIVLKNPSVKFSQKLLALPAAMIVWVLLPILPAKDDPF